MEFSLTVLLFCITAFNVNNACKLDWSNDCVSNSDCCSGFCDNRHGTRELGVCSKSLGDILNVGGKIEICLIF